MFIIQHNDTDKFYDAQSGDNCWITDRSAATVYHQDDVGLIVDAFSKIRTSVKAVTLSPGPQPHYAIQDLTTLQLYTGDFHSGRGVFTSNHAMADRYDTALDATTMMHYLRRHDNTSRLAIIRVQISYAIDMICEGSDLNEQLDASVKLK